MSARRTLTCVGVLAMATALVLGTGCEKETEVIREVLVEVPQWEDPPDAAQGFLGYDDRESSLTICGNCHAGQQTGWRNTDHADAWAGLQASGHAAEYCESCHTVSESGNPASGDVGWTATADERYVDVQCESCHGAGSGHLSDPSGLKPLASIAVDPDSLSDNVANCASCHSGAHHPFAEEWSQSAHGHITGRVLDHLGDEDPGHFISCTACHSGQGALEAWGITANYLEKDVDLADHEAITCAVCHDPHAKNNPGQLRYPIDADPENNLCMKCHNRRGLVDPTSSRGPHSPQGPLLLGNAGWFPPNFPYKPGTLQSHGTSASTRLCASCHVATFEVTDDETGAFVQTVTGHLFLATPCLDENGIPYDDPDCAAAQIDYSACIECHTDRTQAQMHAFYTAEQSTIDNLAAELREMVDMLEVEYPEEFDTSDGGVTTAEGASFNADLAEEPGGAAHNGVLLRQLIQKTVEQVELDYPDLDGGRLYGGGF